MYYVFYKHVCKNLQLLKLLYYYNSCNFTETYFTVNWVTILTVSYYETVYILRNTLILIMYRFCLFVTREWRAIKFMYCRAQCRYSAERGGGIADATMFENPCIGRHTLRYLKCIILSVYRSNREYWYALRNRISHSATVRVLKRDLRSLRIRILSLSRGRDSLEDFHQDTGGNVCELNFTSVRRSV